VIVFPSFSTLPMAANFARSFELSTLPAKRGFSQLACLTSPGERKFTETPTFRQPDRGLEIGPQTNAKLALDCIRAV
jgi:hypothetical protein